MNSLEPSVSVLAKNGKSFYFAGVFLPAQKLAVISELYSFCRYVDDCADELPPDEARLEIKSIKKTVQDPQHDSPLQQKITHLEAHGVHRDHLLDLIKGAEWDLLHEPIHTEEDLDLYCYHVAGIVGLMMNPLMEVQDPQAAGYAIYMGKAMQLTNICRDILEDAQNGRVYIPTSDMQKSGLNLFTLKSPGATPAPLKEQLKKYLAKADSYYELGRKGLPYIPLRCRCVILLASELYRSIGVKIAKHDYEVLEGRTYLTTAEKIIVLLRTLPKMLKLGFWVKPRMYVQEVNA